MKKKLSSYTKNFTSKNRTKHKDYIEVITVKTCITYNDMRETFSRIYFVFHFILF